MNDISIEELSRIDKIILTKIRQVNATNVLDYSPKDIQVMRDKVVARLCDDDRNFARYYMSLITKDMRYLSIRRGQAPSA